MIDRNREEDCAPPRLPACLTTALAGYRWARDTVGEAGAVIYRLHGRADAPDLYLKHGEAAVANDVADEAARLQWLSSLIPVPTVRHVIRTSDEAWLLTTAMSGQTAYQWMEAYPDARPNVVDALAAFLRRLHAIPATICPFDSGHPHRLALARARIDTGLVDTEDFDEERLGWSAQQVWEAMHDLLPFTPDAVVTHGDYSLDNIFLHDGEVTGCIDVGRAGIADRYQDLAIAWNCLGAFDPALQDRFMRQYGLAEIDQRKLQFHLMLDELF